MNRPTAATDTAEQWRLYAVLTYRDDPQEPWWRRRAMDRELREWERKRRKERRNGRTPGP